MSREHSHPPPRLILRSVHDVGCDRASDPSRNQPSPGFSLCSKPPSPTRGEGKCHTATLSCAASGAREVTPPQTCARFPCTSKSKGSAPGVQSSVRLHHRRRRLGRLGAGPPALRQKRQQGPALRGRPGHAARQRAGRNPRQLFGHGLFRSALPLDRTQGHDPDRQPQQSRRSRPPLRKYEQARVLGGGSSINGQMANRGAPTDYDEWEARGAAGWGWNDVLPYFKKVERDLDFDGAYHGKDGRIPVRRIPAGALDRACAGRRRGLQARRHAVPARPERRVRRRLFPGHAFQPGRAARLGRDGLSRSRDAQARQSDDLDQHAGQGAAVRGHALRRREGAWSTAREQEFRGREIILSCGAIHSPAHLLRAGIGPVGHLQDMGIPGPDGAARRRPAPDGSSLDLAVVLRPPRRAHERAHAAPHPAGLALFLGAVGRAQGRHVRRRADQVGLACGRRADRLAADLRQQDLFRDRAGQARLARSRAPSRSSSSICCPTGATSIA